MKRFSSHFIYLFPDKLLRKYYAELDGQNRLIACRPLEEEIEAVSFYNGILFFTEKEKAIDPHELLYDLQQLQSRHPEASAFRILELSKCMATDFRRPVDVFHLDGLDLSSPKFCANDGSGNGYIQRL